MLKQDLLDFNLQELQDFCVLNELPKFRATQIWRWIYCFGIKSFKDMNNISKITREFLNEISVIPRLEVSEMQESKDGTIKWLIKLNDGSEIETVYIPQDDRGTVCLSSQVGCTLNCSFCHTGTQALVRNLKSSEIIGQLMLVMDHLRDWPSGKNNRKVTNIVMMGMGEPLLNYENLIKSIDLITNDRGLGMSPKRITVSTAGIAKMIKKLADDEVKFNLSFEKPIKFNNESSIQEITSELNKVLEHKLKRKHDER